MCNLALVNRHANRIFPAPIMLSSVACLVLPRYQINGTIFGRGGGIIQLKMRVLVLPATFLLKHF